MDFVGPQGPWLFAVDIGSLSQWPNFQFVGIAYLLYTWKINMEHTNHPFRKENDLPNLYDYVPC